MNKIIYALIVIITSLASAFAGAIYSGKYFVDIIGEQEEETRLQTLAYSQSLLEKLDSENYVSARENAISAITSSIFVLDAENFYEFKYRDACLLHKMVYGHRSKFPEKYNPEGEEEKTVQTILEMWSNRDCETQPRA